MLNTKKLGIISFLFSIVLFLSFSGSHPVGRSGAPGDGLCSDCHSGGGGFDGEITIAGVPSNPVPGQIYDVTVTVEATVGSPVRGGFQVVALRSNDDSQAGTWSNPDGSSSLKTSGGRVYFGHQPFRNFGGNPSVSWEAEWEAPSITDEVIFYMAGNMANGNGSTSGDKIISDQYSVDIVVVDPIEIDFVDIGQVSCNGDSDGSAMAIVTGGVPPYSYNWENGEDTDLAAQLSGGSNSLTVTDDNGDMGVSNVIIPEPDEIEVDFELIEPTCFGEEDGVILIEAFGGTGVLECMWFDFGNECSITGLDTGIYELTVTDENNCSFVTDFELEEPDELTAVLSSTDAGAGDDDGTASCTPSGGTAPYIFNWSNGESEEALTSTITDLPSGSYFVTVVDVNDCLIVGEVDVDGVDCNIQTSIAAIDVNCHGASSGEALLSVNGAIPPLSFNWSNGDNTQDISDLPAAWYYVTVTDNDQCMAVDSIEIIQPDSLSIDSSELQMVECVTDSSGSIYVYMSGGTPDYSFYWSNGIRNDTTTNGMGLIVNPADSLEGLAAGIYYLTVVDSNACSLIDSFEIQVLDTVPPESAIIDMDLYLDDQGMVSGPEPGMIMNMLSDNCGIDSVDYMQSDYDCMDIGDRVIAFIAFDHNDNSSVSELNLTIQDTIPPVLDCIQSDTVIFNCDAFDYGFPQFFDNCGITTIQLLSGLDPGSVFPEGLTNVAYEAIDNSGNISTCSFQVEVIHDLELQYDVQDASCLGNDGSIDFIFEGGTPPYNIEPQLFEDLAAGDYMFTLTDSNGCVVEELITVGMDDPGIDYSINLSDVSCFGSKDGSIEILFVNDPINYEISYDMGVDPGNLEAGVYALTITDVNTNCRIMDSFEITQPDEFMILNVVVDQDSCTGQVLDLFFDTQGGTLPLSNVEYQEMGTTSVITATDLNGCIASTTIELDIPDPIVIDDYIISSDPCTGQFLDIELQISGGAEPYSIDIQGQSDFVVGVLITDANGCELFEVYTLDRIDTQLELIDFVINAPSGGGLTATVIPVYEGGTEPYTFVWTDDSGTIVSMEEEAELPNGSYMLEITDALGCMVSSEVIVDIIDSVVELGILENITVYPNPVQGELRVDLNGEIGDVSIQLYDLNSKLVISKNSIARSRMTVDMSELDQGVYILMLESNKKRIYQLISKI